MLKHPLHHLPAHVQTPNYPREHLKPSIVHIGFGAFARAHQAFVLDQLHRMSRGGDWGYCAIYTVPAANEPAFAAQDYLYSVMTRDQDSDEITVCGALTEVITREKDGLQAVLDRLAHPDTAIISLTVTEKGYCTNADGRLDTDHPDIQADLHNPHLPKTLPGILCAALKQRKETVNQGLSILSCDNLPGNGARCRAAVMDFATQTQPDLAAWIDENIRFPNTMVDRIVPAYDAQARALLKQQLGGVDDPEGIVCERFLQWVIEDDFVAGRPDWDLIPGVVFTHDVTPHEMMKLRMLNGTHSFLAYLGYLGGYETIADTMENPAYRQAAKHLMLDVQAPTLPPIQDIDFAAYADSLIQRFSNHKLRHLTAQIATDGSQKLPQRFLQSLSQHLQRQSDFAPLALGIAAWMVYVRGVDLNGHHIEVKDPHASLFARSFAESQSAEEYVNTMLEHHIVFPEQLSHNAQLRRAVLDAYNLLLHHGADYAVKQLNAQQQSPA